MIGLVIGRVSMNPLRKRDLAIHDELAEQALAEVLVKPGGANDPYDARQCQTLPVSAGHPTRS